MKHNITINRTNSKRRQYGLIEGIIEVGSKTFTWQAIMHKDNIDKALCWNKAIGPGIISKFKLFTDIPMSNYTKRFTYAEFKNGEWEVYNMSCNGQIIDIVNYLCRIYSIRAISA